MHLTIANFIVATEQEGQEQHGVLSGSLKGHAVHAENRKLYGACHVWLGIWRSFADFPSMSNKTPSCNQCNFALFVKKALRSGLGREE